MKERIELFTQAAQDLESLRLKQIQLMTTVKKVDAVLNVILVAGMLVAGTFICLLAPALF